ncbi:hypothetical protein RHMOL_Rhmol07G0196800 [Rhododendron molle]|uniref:Uncharacterized protein n=1 Tax=Rhododendron molle TaxID=49168 RepID=A0ACC0N2G5_RHOML|nr:hypothetical protein RHMOL_Rhmol07G0196800 [Rhododendron molle]
MTHDSCKFLDSRTQFLSSKEDLKNARIRDWAGLLLQAGDYMEYCHVFLAPAAAAPPVVPVWPRAPSFVSFHSDDGKEEHLALTPCTTQLYTSPAGVSQAPSEVVQEWLHAYQSAEALVRRQHRQILEVKTVVDGLPASWVENRVPEFLKKYGEVEKIKLARNMPSAEKRILDLLPTIPMMQQ